MSANVCNRTVCVLCGVRMYNVYSGTSPLKHMGRREVSMIQEGPCFTGYNEKQSMCLRQCEVCMLRRS